MTKFNLFIENFHKYSSIPLTVIKDDNVLLYYPKNNNMLTLINYLYFKKTFNNDIAINCYKDNLFLAKVHIKNKKDEFDLLVGPIAKRNILLDEAETITKYLKIPTKVSAKVMDEIITLVKLDFDEFIKLIIFLNYSINLTTITAADITKDIDLNTLRKYRNIQYPANFEDRFDKNLKDIINNFDHLGFLEFLNDSDETVLSHNQLANSLRGYKNNIIFYLARMSKHIIDIGTDYKTVDNLVFMYINRLEELETYLECEELFKEAIKKMFDESNKLKPVIKFRPVVKNAIEYINNNLESSLQVNELAKIFGLNRSYLSKAFIDDTGVSIQAYIMNLKLEHAKKLLRTSDIGLKEISERLYFSSQSHFQNVFKKHFNQTPTQYRNSN